MLHPASIQDLEEERHRFSFCLWGFQCLAPMTMATIILIDPITVGSMTSRLIVCLALRPLLPPPTGLPVGIGMPVVALVPPAVPLPVVMLFIKDVFELWNVEEELDNDAKEENDSAAEAFIAGLQSTLN